MGDLQQSGKILGISKVKVIALFALSNLEKGILFKRNNNLTIGDYTGANNYADSLMGRRLTAEYCAFPEGDLEQEAECNHKVICRIGYCSRIT